MYALGGNVRKKCIYQAHMPGSLGPRLPYGWHDWAALARAVDLHAYFYGLRSATGTALFKKIGGVKVLPVIQESEDEVPCPDAIDYELSFTAHAPSDDSNQIRPYGWNAWAASERAKDIQAFYFHSKKIIWADLLMKPELKKGFYKADNESHQNDNNSNVLTLHRADSTLASVPLGELYSQSSFESYLDSVLNSPVYSSIRQVSLDNSHTCSLAISSQTFRIHSSISATNDQGSFANNQLSFKQIDNSSLLRSLEHINLKEFAYTEITIITNVLQQPVLLGEGAYGTVYLGKLVRSTEKVVIKQIECENMTQNEAINEAQIQKLLDDQGIAPKVFGVSVLENSISIIQEYVDECTTLDNAYYSLSREEWVDVLLKLAKAIKKMHELHVLHNDIKGDNVIIQKNDDGFRVLLIDFGLATYRQGREFSYLEPDDREQYSHMAPELFFGVESQKESDIYSFGKLIELSNIYDELEPTVKKCLSMNFLKRPSIDDIIEKLEECEYLFKYVIF